MMYQNRNFNRKGGDFGREEVGSEEIKQMISYIENGGDELNIFRSKNGVVFKFVNKVSRDWKSKTKTSQLRKFYDELLTVRVKDKYRLMRIELNAAYARARNYVGEPMYDFISEAVDKILSSDTNQGDRLERFKHIFEAIIAYNALNEGDKNE
ncbi:MAG: type III-A CRISPR-associated protein Csm2 [Thermoplasmatales archaeon]